MDEFSQIFHPVEKLKRIKEDVKGNLGLFFTLAATESVKNRKRFIYATGTNSGWRLSISFRKKHSSKFFL